MNDQLQQVLSLLGDYFKAAATFGSTSLGAGMDFIDAIRDAANGMLPSLEELEQHIIEARIF